MATSISYNSTASGDKTLSKSITDINPNIDNAVAKTFTQKLNALTTNTLSTINRIDKTEIDPDITYYDIAITKNADYSEGDHFIWNESEPTKVTVSNEGEIEHEYLTLLLKVNNSVLNLDDGIPYTVERHAYPSGSTNGFSIVVSQQDGITFDMAGPLDGYVTVTIPSGKMLLGNPASEYYFNGVTFTITGEQ